MMLTVALHFNTVNHLILEYLKVRAISPISGATYCFRKRQAEKRLIFNLEPSSQRTIFF